MNNEHIPRVAPKPMNTTNIKHQTQVPEVSLYVTGNNSQEQSQQQPQQHQHTSAHSPLGQTQNKCANGMPWENVESQLNASEVFDPSDIVNRQSANEMGYSENVKLATGGGYKSYKDFKYFAPFHQTAHVQTNDFTQQQYVTQQATQSQQPSQTQQQYYGQHQQQQQQMNIHMRNGTYQNSTTTMPSQQQQQQQHYNLHHQYYAVNGSTQRTSPHLYYPLLQSSNFQLQDVSSQTLFTAAPKSPTARYMETEADGVPQNNVMKLYDPTVCERVKVLTEEVRTLNEKVEKLMVQNNTLYNLITNRDEVMHQRISELINKDLAKLLDSHNERQQQQNQQQQNQQQQQQNQQQQQQQQQNQQQQKVQQQKPQQLLHQSPTPIKILGKVTGNSVPHSRGHSPSSPGMRPETAMQPQQFQRKSSPHSQQNLADAKVDKSLFIKNLAKKYINEEELHHLQSDLSECKVSAANDDIYENCEGDHNILDIQKLKKQRKRASGLPLPKEK